MHSNNIGGNFGFNPYGQVGGFQGFPTQGPGGGAPVGAFNPYSFMSLFQNLLQSLEQLRQGWGGFVSPHYPPYGYPQPRPEPPIQALYGVAIGPRPEPRPEPPIQALYGVAIGPRPEPRPEPPIQALYGVAIGPRPSPVIDPPVQALYGVAIGPRNGGDPPIQALYGVALA